MGQRRAKTSMERSFEQRRWRWMAKWVALKCAQVVSLETKEPATILREGSSRVRMRMGLVDAGHQS